MTSSKPGTSGPRSQGRPKDPAKHAAILETAGKLFLEQGYERTTVEAIAAAAGVSKLTVYSHFGDKTGLFRTLVTNKCRSYFEHTDYDSLRDLPVDQALTRIARSFMGLMLNPDVVALHRLLMASAAHNPELTEMFYGTGPEPTITGVADVLRELDKAGTLRIEDPWRAADHLLSMLRGDVHLRALLNLRDQADEARVEAHITDCVAVFLRAYERGGNP